jgi:hypothetical protein
MRYTNYPLSGILKCDCCKKGKKRWRVSRTGLTSRGVKYYQCIWKNKTKWFSYRCPSVDVKADDMNTLVKNEIMMLINDPWAIHRAINKADNLLQHRSFIEDSIAKANKKIERVTTAQSNVYDLRYKEFALTKEDYEREFQKLEDKLTLLEKQRDDLYDAFDQYTNVEAQKRVMEALSRIWDSLESIFEDDELLKEFLRLLIDEIVIFSEPNDKIKLNWRPRKDWSKQHIPHTILIKFRLPQDFLNELYITPDDDLEEWWITQNNPNKPTGNWWWVTRKQKRVGNWWWSNSNVQQWGGSWKKVWWSRAILPIKPFNKLIYLLTCNANDTPISLWFKLL